MDDVELCSNWSHKAGSDRTELCCGWSNEAVADNGGLCGVGSDEVWLWIGYTGGGFDEVAACGMLSQCEAMHLFSGESPKQEVDTVV